MVDRKSIASSKERTPKGEGGSAGRKELSVCAAQVARIPRAPEMANRKEEGTFAPNAAEIPEDEKESNVLRRYTFKLYPNADQEEALREQARMCAMLWNALLDMRETFYRRARQKGEKKTSLTAFDQGKDLTALRAECPEWAAQPRGTQERVAEMLDNAFKAFFRRAKSGAGKSSGYPRFKSVFRADSVHLREPAKSSWTFSAHSAPAGNGEVEEDRKATSGCVAKGLRKSRSEHLSAHSGPARKSEPKGGKDAPQPQIHLASANWRLKMRGVPGAIKARGKFPVAPLSHKTADIRFYDGAWWFSICVAQEPRRAPGSKDVIVDFDLIDEFASVNADGQSLAGLTDFGKADPRARGREVVDALHLIVAEADSRARGREGREASNVQSQGDRRFKKFSIRWRRAKQRVARIKAKEARRRKEALHRWTTAIVRDASSVEAICPPIADLARTGRGNAAYHGAEVDANALINRRVREQAPSAALAMLEYKASEAGVPFTATRPEDHQIRIGQELKTVAIKGRVVRRKLKKELEYAS